MWAVEVILQDEMCAVDETVLQDEMWAVEAVLDDVDDPSLQSLTIATLSSFANRQSKLGLYCILMSRKLL